MAMTIYQLKQELINNGVSLPESSARKEVYENLYLEHVLTPKLLKTQRKSVGARKNDFSSDEEAGIENTGNGVGGEAEESEVYDPAVAAEVEGLSNEEIYVALTNLGQTIGPVVATTREMYKKRLIKAKVRNGHVDVGELVVENAENGLHYVNGHNVSDDTGVEMSQQFSSDEEVEIVEQTPVAVSTEKQSGSLTKEQKERYDALMTPGYYSSPAAGSSSSVSDGPTSEGGRLKLKSSAMKQEATEGTNVQMKVWNWIAGMIALAIAIIIAYEFYAESQKDIQ